MGAARKPSRGARSHLRLVRGNETRAGSRNGTRIENAGLEGGQADEGQARGDDVRPEMEARLREMVERIDTEAMAEEAQASRSAKRRLVFLTLLVLLFCLWIALN